MTTKGRRIAAALVLGGLVLATGWGLWLIRPVLAPFLLAVMISYLLAPLVNALGRRGVHRGWAILLVFGAIGGVIGLGLWKLLPAAVAEMRRLAEAIPEYSVRALDIVDGLQQRVRETWMPPGLRESVHQSITEMEVRSVQALNRLLGADTIKEAAGFLLALIVAPFLAFYLLKDLDQFKERFVGALPSRYRLEILGLLRGLDRVLAGFVRGQLLLALTVGGMATLATYLLGLRYAVLLGIWAGITELVPYVGPFLGAVPAVLAGISVSPLLAIQVALAFFIIQQLEGAVLSPKIMGDSVGLHPLVVILAILAGGTLFGVWGMILALPVAGTVRVVWCFLIARLTEAPRLGG